MDFYVFIVVISQKKYKKRKVKIMKTFMQTAEIKSQKWYLVDATNMPLGRLASQVAAILRGKNKPEFTPNELCGDHVIIINTDKVVLTGNKLEDKYYRYHTGYIGGLKEIQYKTLMSENSDKAVYQAVKKMLPKNALGRQMLTYLRVYKDDKHEQTAQKPEVLNLEGRR